MIFLNVVYNLALIILVLCVFWSAKDGQYAITLGSVFISAFVIYMKIRLKKEVSELLKKRNEKV